MDRVGGLVFLVWCSLAAGCLAPEPDHTTAAKPRSVPGANPLFNFVQMDIALLERPVGDPFLNKELWDSTDEQVVGLERKARLDDNGFRVGEVIGLPPTRLQALLISDRSCINPRRQLLPPGRPVTPSLGPNLLHVDFVVKSEGQPEEVSLDQAQFLLEVTPTFADNGQTKLRIVPKVQHGETLPDFRPAADGSDWTFQLSRPNHDFAGLNWEVTLAANSYLVVGANFDLPDSFGYRAFVQDQGNEPAQRLLVLRTSRTFDGETASLPTLKDMAGLGPSPPLALQAPMSAVRGHRP